MDFVIKRLDRNKLFFEGVKHVLHQLVIKRMKFTCNFNMFHFIFI